MEKEVIKSAHCYNCGKFINRSVERLADGNIYCYNCKKELNAFVCHICNEKHVGKYRFKYDVLYDYNIRDEEFHNKLRGLGVNKSCNDCVEEAIYEYKKKSNVCDYCGKYHSNMKEKYCDKCIIQCSPCYVCNKPTMNSYPIDGVYKKVCRDCHISKSLIKCSVCSGLTIHNDRSLIVTNPYVMCEKCKENYPEKCDVCNKASLMDDIMIRDGVKICNHCHESKVKCFECGAYTDGIAADIKDEDLINKKRLLCESCARNHGVGFMGPWNYKPKEIYFNGKDSYCRYLYFGFENETYIKSRLEKTRDRHMGKILQHFPTNLLYCKFDGSIGGQRYEPGGEHGKHGFELVSHPMSFEFFKTYENWDKLFTTQTITHKTCGMHIHITRAAFTPLHLYKFITLVHANDSFIEYIAERSLKNNVYTTNISGERVASDCKRFKKPKGTDDIYRRAKVNLCNDFTVELRFFSNVTSVGQLHKNMEFAHALYTHTKEIPQSCANDVDMFIKFIRVEKAFYPELNSFLDTKEWIRKENEIEEEKDFDIPEPTTITRGTLQWNDVNVTWERTPAQAVDWFGDDEDEEFEG